MRWSKSSPRRDDHILQFDDWFDSLVHWKPQTTAVSVAQCEPVDWAIADVDGDVDKIGRVEFGLQLFLVVCPLAFFFALFGISGIE